METETIIIHSADNNNENHFQAKLGVHRMVGSELREVRIWNTEIYPKMATKDPLGEALIDYFIQLLKNKRGRLLLTVGS